jgi:hypothetical protein
LFALLSVLLVDVRRELREEPESRLIRAYQALCAGPSGFPETQSDHEDEILRADSYLETVAGRKKLESLCGKLATLGKRCSSINPSTGAAKSGYSLTHHPSLSANSPCHG